MHAKEIFEAILELPVYDIHSHIEGDSPGALGLHDVLLYHMVVSDLYSAGCPDGGRVVDRSDPAETQERLKRAVRFLPHIRNTSSFWGVRLIAKDLYGWTEPIDPESWPRLHAAITERASDAGWHREVLERSRARRITTELARRGNGRLDDVCDYSLEWAFFARTQHGIGDAPLYELERAWNVDEPGQPLNFTLSGSRPPVDQPIVTVEDVREAVSHYCRLMPNDRIVSTAQHFATDINYCDPTDDDMARALASRGSAGDGERDIYASYILNAFLQELQIHGDEIVFILSIGAEALPFETASRLRQETIGHFGSMVARHANLRFICMNASRHANQSLCTLSRELPNLTLAGYWWHSFFPDAMSQVISERLDMLPASNQIAFFSDAYCVEWLYAKTRIVKQMLAEVLQTKVNQGRFSTDEAVGIAADILYHTPARIVGQEKQRPAADAE